MTDQTAAIEGATGTLRTRVDGTVVLMIEFEPNNRMQVMELFGSPGSPVAIARLVNGFKAVKEQAAPIGPMCRDAIGLCRNSEFQKFIHEEFAGIEVSETEARRVLIELCGVQSRRELDTWAAAATKFVDLFNSYRTWLRLREQNR